MENHPEIVDLPESLEARLRQLGGARAPDELWQRVALGISEPAEAPDELWDRIEPEVQAQARPRPVLVFRRLAAVAAVVAVFALGFLLSGRDKPAPSQPVYAYYERTELRDYYRSRAIPVEVQEQQLSPAARGLAGSLGAPVEGQL